MPASSRSTTEAPATVGGWRREAALVIGVVVTGCLLRGLRPEAMAIEHFDEGVYASNLYCGHLDPPFAYPMRHLYAPPLFPAVLEWAQIVAGPAAVLWVNVLLGSLTVLAVWWTTRCWFGRTAAIAAAMLAATSEYHIAFSRMALTDVPVSLFMLLGVFAGGKAILTGRPLWIVAAGLVAGLAWCTKYNGWLTLAVTGAGTFAACLVPMLLARNSVIARLLFGAAETRPSDARRDRRSMNFRFPISDLRSGPAAIRWGLTAAIASVIFWVFVLRDLEPLGGYGAVAKNHAGYFAGPGGWWSGFLRQAEAHDLLMGWPTCVGIGAALLLGAVGHASQWRAARSIRLVLLAVGLVLIARLLTASGLLAAAALMGFVVALRRAVAGDAAADSTQLAAWMLLAWFVGLLVAAPLYFPYPRLTLPWVVGCWPLAGAAIAAISECLGRPAQAIGRGFENRKSGIAVAGACIMVAGSLWFLKRGPASTGWPPAWEQRALAAGIAKVMLIEIESTAARTRKTESPGMEAVVYVQGDPAMFYQLASLCRSRPIVVVPVAEASGLRPTTGTPTFVVTHDTAGHVGPQPASVALIQSYEYRPSEMVLLDRMSAAAIRDSARPVDVLRLDELQTR